MSRKLFAILTLVLVGTACGIFIWRAQDVRARSERLEAEIVRGLSDEELSLILTNQATTDRGSVEFLLKTPDARRNFLKSLREHFALAAQARREGLSEDEKFRVNVEYKKNILLADLYRAKLTAAQGKYYVVPQESIENVWRTVENEKRFELDMETLRTIQIEVAKARGDESVYTKLQGGSLEKARNNWANAKVLSDLAKADADFMAQPAIGLRFKVLEAGILSVDYLRKHWTDKIKATPAEIGNHLAANPALDVGKKREKAEAALKRVAAGEDFAKVATELSEDRSTRSKGGLYENTTPEDIWPEVANAALALEPGRFADRIVETNTGFHVVKLEKKQVVKNPDGSEKITFSVRHILLQRAFEDPLHNNPDVPAPFISAETVAKNEIERQKRDAFVSWTISKNDISIPEDVALELPPVPTAKIK
jgi:hypothetical protein